MPIDRSVEVECDAEGTGIAVATWRLEYIKPYTLDVVYD
jgi:hypothetical protein